LILNLYSEGIQAGHVPVAEHPYHAREFLGLAGVDALYQGVGMGGAHHLHPEHAFLLQVGRIDKLAGHLGRRFPAQFLFAPGGHQPPPTG
jgi:hypothetical protein